MKLNSIALLVGHIVLFAAFAVLWYYVPPDGGKPKFAGTKLERPITVVFSAAFLLAAGLVTLGFIGYFGSQ